MPVKLVIRIQEEEDYLLEERGEKMKQYKGKVKWCVCLRGSRLVGNTCRRDECSNQIPSCVCHPVKMKETKDPDQDFGFMDNLPQMLEDWVGTALPTPLAFSEESGLSPWRGP